MSACGVLPSASVIVPRWRRVLHVLAEGCVLHGLVGELRQIAGAGFVAAEAVRIEDSAVVASIARSWPADSLLRRRTATVSADSDPCVAKAGPNAQRRRRRRRCPRAAVIRRAIADADTIAGADAGGAAGGAGRLLGDDDRFIEHRGIVRRQPQHQKRGHDLGGARHRQRGRIIVAVEALAVSAIEDRPGLGGDDRAARRWCRRRGGRAMPFPPVAGRAIPRAADRAHRPPRLAGIDAAAAMATFHAPRESQGFGVPHPLGLMMMITGPRIVTLRFSFSLPRCTWATAATPGLSSAAAADASASVSVQRPPSVNRRSPALSPRWPPACRASLP